MARRAGRILLGVIVMTGLMLAALAALRQLFGPSPPGPAVAGILVVAPLAGGLLARWPGLSWRQLVVAALVSGAVVTLTIGMILPGHGFSYGYYPGVARDVLQHILVYSLAMGSGVFVLPLADPAVRAAGPRPHRGRIVVTAAVIVGAILLLELALSGRWGGFGRGTFGLGTLVGGGLVAVILAGVGFLWTLWGRPAQGAWSGALGLLVALGAVIGWIATGARWFP